MNKLLLYILLFCSTLACFGQQGQDNIDVAEINIRSGDEQAAFQVDYTINPDIKALPVTADGAKDGITAGQDYTISKGENDKYTFILTDSEGNKHEVETDSMPVTIEDKDGNMWHVDEEGKVIQEREGNKEDESDDEDEEDLFGLATKVDKSIYRIVLIRDRDSIPYSHNQDVYFPKFNMTIGICILKKDSVNAYNPIVFRFKDSIAATPRLSNTFNLVGNPKLEFVVDSIESILVKMKYYEIPSTEFRSLNFNGSFGFDHYNSSIYSPHREDGAINGRGGSIDHEYIMRGSNRIYAPNISFISDQTPTIQVKFSDYDNMKKDSLFSNIKIYSQGGMVRLNGLDTLSIRKEALNSSFFDLSISIGRNTALNYDSVLIVTNRGNLLGKINVFNRNRASIDSRRLILIQIQNRPGNSNRSRLASEVGNITRQLNNLSYNQAFINWDIDTLSIPFDSIQVDSLSTIWNNKLKTDISNISGSVLGGINSNVLRLVGRFLSRTGRPPLNISNMNTKIGVIFSDEIRSSSYTFEGLALGFGERMFIIGDNSYKPKLYVHELGHCLNLHHPFGKTTDSPPDNKILEEGAQRESSSKNSTDNVMDYDFSRMHTFWLWQWTIMNNGINYYR